MALHYIEQNITEVKQGIIVHGCNCQGVMGSGVAKAIRDKWPIVYPPYKAKCDQTRDKSSLLGSYVAVEVGKNLWVINGFTQEYFGSDGRQYASSLAISQVLNKISEFAIVEQLSVYIPRIGCGLGGLDWDKDVEPIVEGYSDLYDIYVCDL